MAEKAFEMSENSVISINSNEASRDSTAKDEILGIFSEISKVSDAVFDPLFAAFPHLRDQVDVPAAVAGIKKDLEETLREQMEMIWENNLATHVKMMEKIRNMYRTHGSAWRPQGKTAQEQTLPLMIDLWKKKNEVLKDKIDKEQVPVLEELVQKVEEARAELQLFTEERNKLMDEVEMRTEQVSREIQEHEKIRADVQRKIMQNGA